MGMFSHDDWGGTSERTLTEEEIIVNEAFCKYADDVAANEKQSALGHYGATYSYTTCDSVVFLVEYFKQNNVNPLDYLTQDIIDKYNKPSPSEQYRKELVELAGYTSAKALNR